MKSFEKILIGIVFIGAGLIIGSNSFGLTNIDLFFEGWWTLFIIIPCFIGLIKAHDVTGNVIGLIIGTTLLLASRDLISFQLIAKLIVPLIFVVIGISIICNQSIKQKITKKFEKKEKTNLDNIVATFSEQKIEIDDDFKDSNIDSIFGSVVLDLRNAKMKKENIIVASAIFGGIKIYVPEDLEVKIKATPIFGGVSNNTIKKENKKNIIYIDATCVFGGIEIK